jgi:hypothetical protein
MHNGDKLIFLKGVVHQLRLLAAGVLVHRVCKPLLLLSFRVIVCRVVRGVFYFLRRVEEFFKNNFFLRWLCKLFDKALPCGWAYAALAMCLQNAWAIHCLQLF